MAGQLKWSVDSAGWERGVLAGLDALIQRMTAEAQAYADYALESQNDALVADARRLLDWIDSEAEVIIRDTVQDALSAAPFAENVVLDLIRAVESPIDRITKRDSDEDERWSDLVDWLYQIPGSLRDLMDVEGLRMPAGDVLGFIQLAFQQNLIQGLADRATVLVSGVLTDQQLEGLVA